MADGNLWWFACKTCKHRYSWVGTAVIQPCPKCASAKSVGAQRATPAGTAQINAQTAQVRKSVTIPLADSNSKYREAIDLCDEIESLAEDVPERGEDFASSVCDQAGGIRETVERLGAATDAQVTALENMKSGLSRWIR